MVTNREEGGGMNWDIDTLLKQITDNKNLPFITGNSTRYCVMICMGTESKKEWVHLYIYIYIFFSIDSLCYIAETEYCKSTTLQ